MWFGCMTSQLYEYVKDARPAVCSIAEAPREGEESFCRGWRRMRAFMVGDGVCGGAFEDMLLIFEMSLFARTEESNAEGCELSRV